MKSRFLVLLAATAICLQAETVVKSSVPFQFPPAVGVIRAVSNQGNGVLFSYASHSANRSLIALSWSLPVKAEKGSISIFNLAGTKIKTFSITEQQGRVNWETSGGTKLANGIYFASLTYGSCKKNLQMLISR